MAENLPVKNDSQILLYQTESGQTKIEVLLEDETVWLTQKLMAELFQTTKQNISLHIQNIYAEGELTPDSTVKEYLTVQKEGSRQVSRVVDFYNLDMIISVGYRVKSHVATRFRQWATQRLREYIVEGFVLDDERLKNPDQPFDYFDELLRRIQDIRTSERRFYQKITDIYATSIDYDPRFFHKKSSKNCPSGGDDDMHLYITKDDISIKNRARNAFRMGVTVFDQTFVKSLRVRNALREGGGNMHLYIRRTIFSQKVEREMPFRRGVMIHLSVHWKRTH